MKFRCFVGIDQTGACDSKGRPRALPVTVLFRETPRRWTLVASDHEGKMLELPALRLDAIRKLLAQARAPEGDLAIVIDCVLGLPDGVVAPTGGTPGDALWGLVARAKEAAGFGRAPAETFFGGLLAAGAGYPRRRCEVAAGSNSVFQARPYQKNIQTGTYRFWKEMAQADRWANVWPFDSADTGKKGAPWLFEGYPSYLWRTLWGLPTRQPEKIASLPAALSAIEVRTRDWARLGNEPDHADSAVLALGALALQEEGRLFSPFEGFAAVRERLTEGWIVGVTPTAEPAAPVRPRAGTSRSGRTPSRDSADSSRS